jgi:hypothetical protein
MSVEISVNNSLRITALPSAVARLEAKKAARRGNA